MVCTPNTSYFHVKLNGHGKGSVNGMADLWQIEMPRIHIPLTSLQLNQAARGKDDSLSVAIHTGMAVRNGPVPNETEWGRVGDEPGRATSALSEIYGWWRRHKTDEKEKGNSRVKICLSSDPDVRLTLGCLVWRSRGRS